MTFVIEKIGHITSWTSNPRNHSNPDNQICFVANFELPSLEVRVHCRLIGGKIVVCNKNHHTYIPKLVTSFPPFEDAKPCFLQKESTYSNFRITSKMTKPPGFYQEDDVFTLKISLQLDKGRIIPAVEILDEPLIEAST
jgi:hypothetical protein